jgi:hypothetical protein
MTKTAAARKKIIYSLALGTIFTLTASLAGCGSADSPNGAEDTASPASAAVPPPSHQVNGRTVTVSLPYDGRKLWAWQLAQKEADIAPFTLDDITAGPLNGAGPLGVTSMTFSAQKPGTAELKFWLIPADKLIFGPPAYRFQGEPKQVYTAKVSVN